MKPIKYIEKAAPYILFIIVIISIIFIGPKKGWFFIFISLPIIQLILIKWIDISRAIILLSIVTCFCAILATIFSLLTDSPNFYSDGTIYLYMIFIVNLTVYFIVRHFKHAKKTDGIKP